MTENHALTEAMAEAICADEFGPHAWEMASESLRDEFKSHARAAFQAYLTFTQDDGK